MFLPPPDLFMSFFVFSLCVTDGWLQRKNKFQILGLTYKEFRNSCNTQAHFLYFLSFSLTFFTVYMYVVLGFAIFLYDRNTTQK